ncbi:MAG TPA: SulP family inorganic anion transporter, partial [Holophaga sp.]|nr:SulP family inorganic anion transporter [Holophaga sp.]
MSLSLRPDLGIRRLLPEWGRLFTLADLRADVVAGVTVACIAIPLSLAIALASGVDPAVGLVSAIVGSTVAALFGGAPLGVSGPAAAMAVLVANVIQVHGLGGLLVVGMGCGCLQAATGVLGLGRLIRLVPMPVVAGFTAGIGAIIFIGQLPRALGLPPAEGSHVLDTLVHLGTVLHAARPTALLLALSTVALAFLLPRLLPRAPAPLLSVLLPTAAVGILGLDTALIGRLPSALPGPALPPLPPSGWMG